jgi:hypothetical protein
MRSKPRLYNEGQLPLEGSLEKAVRRVGGWCEMAASLEVSKDVNTKAEKATALGAVIRRQLVKIQQTEKTLYVL